MAPSASISDFRPVALFYRGFEGRAVRRFFEGFQVGDVYLDRGYVACSASYLTALQILALGGYGVLLEISAAAGQNAMPMDDWEIKGEYEFLLPRSSQFQIVGIDRSAKVHVYAARLLSAHTDQLEEQECPAL
jgi:hypothetical protein